MSRKLNGKLDQVNSQSSSFSDVLRSEFCKLLAIKNDQSIAAKMTKFKEAVDGNANSDLTGQTSLVVKDSSLACRNPSLP